MKRTRGAMKHLRGWACMLAFALLCFGVGAFLHAFTVSEGAFTYLAWESATVTDAQGQTRPYEPDGYGQAPPDGALYTFRVTPKSVIPDGYLLFETTGAELALYLGGEELYRSFAVQPEGVDDMGQAKVPLPEDAAGREITMTCRPLAGGMPLFPPLLRMSSAFLESRDDMAYANLFGIQAGIYALALLLVCGLFFTGLAAGAPDWKLLPLMAAAVCLLVYEPAVSYGYYFLTARWRAILTWEGLYFLPPALLLCYLLLNRKKEFWRQLGCAALCSAAALLACYLISLLRGGYLSGYLNEALYDLFRHGVYSGLLHWLTLWLTVACAAIGGYGLLRTLTRTRAEAAALALKHEAVVEGYRVLEESWKQTAALRHEIKNELTALNLLYRQGKLEELGARLQELDRQQERLSHTQFTQNFVVNVILQSAAARAAAAKVRFDAEVMLPKTLPIPEHDLCTLLINLLDNALEASAQAAEDARFIRFRMLVRNGFLAVKCTNSYAAPLREDARGRLLSAKPGGGLHGLGMAQMQAVAEKYHSLLDVSYTGDAFTVQTALQLPGEA